MGKYKGQVTYGRYVDDLLGLSTSLCSSCLEKVTNDIYEPGFFQTGELCDGELFGGVQWLDLEIASLNGSIRFGTKLANHAYVVR